MQGGAGQGVHMPKPKFSIKTEVLGGGGGTVAVAVAETEADRPPPPLCFLVDAFLLTVFSGGLLAREVLYYALCGAISAAKGHHRAPRGPANTVAVHVQCAVQRGAGQCRAVQGRACTCQNRPWPPPVGGVGGYNHHCIGEEVEWRPPLLYANPLGHRVLATRDM